MVPVDVVIIFTNQTENVVVLVKLGMFKVVTDPVKNEVPVEYPVGVTALLADQL